MNNFDVVFAHEEFFKEEEKPTTTKKSIGEWARTLTGEGVYLKGKIKDLLEKNALDKTIAKELAVNPSFFNRVEEKIISIISDNTSSNTWCYYWGLIEENTANLHSLGIVVEDDYSAGLCLCDEIYVSVIQAEYDKL